MKATDRPFPLVSKALVSLALAAAIAAPVAASTFTYVYGDGDELLRIVRHDTGEVVEYGAGPYGRIVSRNEVAFRYDGAGRRIEDDRFAYRWTWRGELQAAAVEEPSGDEAPSRAFAGHLVRYTYDARGRLHTREHLGSLPSDGTGAERPFIELREFVWEGHGLVAEAAYGRPDRTQLRWRKTYVPGPTGVDDAAQLIVEVAPSYSGSPFAGESRLYTYVRDELGTVVGLVAEDEVLSSSDQPTVPVRYLYTPYGDGHAEVGPELRKARFHAELTAAGGVDQSSDNPTTTAAGSLVLTWSLPLDLSALASKIAVERSTADGGWEELPDVTVAPAGPDGDETELLVLPRSGWPRGASFRLQIDGGVRDRLGRSVGGSHQLSWSIAAVEPDEEPPPVIFERLFPVSFDSALAARQTAGGRFPGGQSALFQGAWTDPVTGLSYHRARWYDARNASWLTEDPSGSTDSPNLYAFVGWRPTSLIDPFGREGAEIRQRHQQAFEHNFSPYYTLTAGEGLAHVAQDPGARLAGSILVGLTPGYGDYHDYLQVATGRDHIAGVELTPAERAETTVGLALPFVGGAVVRTVADLPVGKWAIQKADQNFRYLWGRLQELRKPSRAPARPGRRTETAYNARSSADVTQSVLDRIDWQRLDPETSPDISPA